ncbi:MAG: uncharacterized membrane protein YhaH (DUF805 family) [Arenicella sp.]|jgi:uncharacterized membrane protein YhaH (DUF805 family)
MGYILAGFKQYADFNGRAARKPYWMFALNVFFISILLDIIGGMLGIEYLAMIFVLVMLVPQISFAARRLHDTGRSGWWYLLALIPVIGTIIIIVFLAQDSHPDNQYGPNPKGVV